MIILHYLFLLHVDMHVSVIADSRQRKLSSRESAEYTYMPSTPDRILEYQPSRVHS